MGSSPLFSTTEKKKQPAVVVGSSATIINKPKPEVKQVIVEGKPQISVQPQPKATTIIARQPEQAKGVIIKPSIITVQQPKEQPKPIVAQQIGSTSQPVKKPAVVIQPAKKQPISQPQALEPAKADETSNGEISLGVEVIKESAMVLGKVVPKRSSIPVLNYVKLDTSDGRLRLMGSDLEKSVVIDLPTNGKNGCLKEPLLIPLEDLKRLGKTKTDELRFSTENGNILVSYTGERGLRNEVLRKMDPTEFPEIPLPKGEFVPVKGLGLALSEACRFCSDEITRFAITGILLTKGEVVASDGKRLYRRFVPELQQEPRILIPNSKFFGLKQIVEEELSIFASKEMSWLKVGNVLWGGRIIEGKFPDYGEIIPASCENALTLSEDMIKALVEVLGSLPYGKDNRAVKIEFKQESNGWKMVFTTAGETPGTAEIQDVNYQGKEMWFGISPDYLLDALSVAGVTMLGFNGSENPIIIWGEDITTLTMPLKVSAFEPRQEPTEEPVAEETENGSGEQPEKSDQVEGKEEQEPEGVIEESHQEG